MMSSIVDVRRSKEKGMLRIWHSRSVFAYVYT
jgi:hypothetical protein